MGIGKTRCGAANRAYYAAYQRLRAYLNKYASLRAWPNDWSHEDILIETEKGGRLAKFKIHSLLSLCKNTREKADYSLTPVSTQEAQRSKKNAAEILDKVKV